MIKFKNVSMLFHTDKEIKAISDFTFEFPDRGLFSIVGRSGSGKSTLLNLVSGLLKPTAGKIELLSFDLCTISQNEMEFIRQNYVGFVYQDYILLEHLTVYENLLIALDLKGIETVNKIDDVLTYLDMGHLKNTQVSKLSGGEKQRVSIARALVRDVKILLADEPTGALDDANAEVVYNLLKEISKDILVLMITHDIMSAQTYADCVISLSKGEISQIEYKNEIESTKINQNLVVDQPHALSIKEVVHYSNILFKKRIKRIVFTAIFWMISLLLTALSTNLLLTNEQTIIEETITSHETKRIQMVDKSYFEDDIFQANLSPILESFNKTKIYDVQVQMELLSFLALYNQSINQPIFSGTGPIYYFEIDDQLNSNEISLTDYQVAYFINRGILNDQIENQIGQVLNFKNHQLIIKDVIETDFGKFDLQTLLSDPFVDFKRFHDFRTSKISAEGLSDLFTFEYMSLSVNNYDTRVYSSNSLDHIPDEAMIGLKPFSSDEIVIGIQQIAEIANQDSLELTDIPQYLNQFYDFNINGSVYSYKVVGVYPSYNYLYLQGESYDTLVNELSYDFIKSINFAYVLYIENTAQLKQIAKECLEGDLFILTYYSGVLEAAIEYIQSMQILYTYVSLFSYLLLALFIYYFTSHLVSANHKNMGIFLSLGGRKKDLSKIFIAENIKIFIYSLVPTIVLHWLLINIINSFIVETWNFSIQIVSYKPLGIITTILVAGAIGYITIWSSLKKIHKMEMLDVIYDRS
jgi:ABC-type lipoprotein export system ATPase subunit/ABC-type antimicrobial peptide transport system permease subunit